jgi:hypothetical protein
LRAAIRAAACQRPCRDCERNILRVDPLF